MSDLRRRWRRRNDDFDEGAHRQDFSRLDDPLRDERQEQRDAREDPRVEGERWPHEIPPPDQL